MRILVVGAGMLGSATARHLAGIDGVDVVLVGPDAAAGLPAAHHDEGRIVSRLGTDALWSELVGRSVSGMRELADDLLVPCGVATAIGPPGDAEHVMAAEALRDWLGLDLLIGTEAVAAGAPLRFGAEEAVVLERDGGHLSPRRYVELATARAAARGADRMPLAARALRRRPAGVALELEDGNVVEGDRAVVAAGAATALLGLLPVRPALRAKSETFAMAELDDSAAAALGGMPCVGRDARDPALRGVYVLPPIRYPDGRLRLKVGADTRRDRWLGTAGALAGWYGTSDTGGALESMRREVEALTGPLPARWSAHRCADGYTAHGRPYVDVVEPGRVVVATGGNGRSAQAADELGRMAAELAIEGDWSSPVPREALRFVAAGAPWRGAELLGDRGGFAHASS